jgi:hypothetical protein
MNNPLIEMRANVTRPQADTLQKKFAALPFRVQCRFEYSGSALTAIIDCGWSQEKAVRDILHDIPISTPIDIYVPPPRIEF